MALASTCGEDVHSPTRSARMMIELPKEDEGTIDCENVPSSIAAIAPILRVANEIETDNPRVAYLCRFHAYVKAESMDPTAGGEVHQFKTSLLHRLEKDEQITIPKLAKSDPREIQMYYHKFYDDNIRDDSEEKKTPEERAKLYQIATVLYDVLKMFVPLQKIKEQTHRYAKEVERKNILLQNQQIARDGVHLEREVAALRRSMKELEKTLGVKEVEEKNNNVLREKIKGLESNVAELNKWKTEMMMKLDKGEVSFKTIIGAVDSSATTTNCNLPLSTDSQPLLARGVREVETAAPWWKNCCGVLDFFKISSSSSK